MPNKVAGTVSFAAGFVLDTIKKVILYTVLLVLAVIAIFTGLSALAYHIASK